MKRLIQLVTVLLLVLIVFYGVILVASESGEVLVLSSVDADGKTIETRLWTVEYDGNHWLRAGSPGNAWYVRLLARPEVAFRLGNQSRTATAVPEPAANDAINTLMNEKYGWADELIDFVFGRGDATAIRLVVASGSRR